MDKSLRQEGSNPLSKESLLAAKLKSSQYGNVFICLWGHWMLQQCVKANAISSMFGEIAYRIYYFFHYHNTEICRSTAIKTLSQQTPTTAHWSFIRQYVVVSVSKVWVLFLTCVLDPDSLRHHLLSKFLLCKSDNLLFTATSCSSLPGVWRCKRLSVSLAGFFFSLCQLFCHFVVFKQLFPYFLGELFKFPVITVKLLFLSLESLRSKPFRLKLALSSIPLLTWGNVTASNSKCVSLLKILHPLVWRRTVTCHLAAGG